MSPIDVTTTNQSVEVSTTGQTVGATVSGGQGPQGPTGAAGAAGQGVPVGGTTGQVLAKASATNYDTAWVTGGGGSSAWADITGKPSTFAPSAHTHGNITNDGKLGSVSGRLVMTSTAGVLVAAAQDSVITTRQLALASGYSVPPIVFPDFSEQSTAWTGTVAAGSVTGLGGAATLNVGTAAGTVAAGDDSRLSNSRTPTSHGHGNITNAGAIGTTPGQIVVTTTSGVLTTTASIASSAVTGLGTLATQSGTFSGTSSGTNTGDQTITLTGDVTGSGTGSFSVQIAAGAVTEADLANAVRVQMLHPFLLAGM